MGFWEPLFFWIFAVGALVSSVAVVLFRNPLYSALSLIADFFCFAGLYVLLSAHFMAVTQVLVYGGAIMVLFVFIIMLLNLSDADLGPRRFSLHHILAAGVGIGVFVFSATAIWSIVDETKIVEARADAVDDYQIAVEAQNAEDGDVEPMYIAKTPSEVPGYFPTCPRTRYSSSTTTSSIAGKRANPTTQTRSMIASTPPNRWCCHRRWSSRRPRASTT